MGCRRSGEDSTMRSSPRSSNLSTSTGGSASSSRNRRRRRRETSGSTLHAATRSAALTAWTSTAARTSAAWRTRSTRTSSGTALAWLRHRHAASGPGHDRECKIPLVVPSCAAVGTQRVLDALAANPHDAAHRRSIRRAELRIGRATAGAAGLAWRLLRTRGSLRAADDLKLTVGHHGIFVFLPEESSLHEHVEAWRQGVGDVRVLETVERNCPGVLLAAKNELRLFFPARFYSPDGHCDRQKDRHDRERHEQGRHGVSPFAGERLTV